MTAPLTVSKNAQGNVVITAVTTTQVITRHVFPASTGIVSGAFDADGHLVFTLAGGATLDVGPVSAPSAGGTSNIYPLAMPVGVLPGAPVTLGDGPDSLVLYLANNPSSRSAGGAQAILAVIVNGVAVAGPLVVSSDAGEDTGQLFTINGAWGANPVVVVQGEGTGLQNIWVNGVLYNLVPLVTQTPTDSRGGQNINNPVAFVSNGVQSVVFGAPIAVAPPPPQAVETVITSATSGGTALLAGTLDKLVIGVPTLTLPAGSFVGAAPLPTPIDITGQGIGSTTLDCTGLRPTFDKAILVPMVPGCLFASITLRGASISSSLGNNAAGIRENAAGCGATLKAVEITQCQNGILSSGGNWTLTDCVTKDNGASDGFTHEMYFNVDTANVVTLNNHISTQGLKSTHALKSRACSTIVNGGTFSSGGNPDGAVAGSVVDIPQGGSFVATGATFVLKAGSVNTLFFGYGMESAANLASGASVVMRGCVFVDETGSGGSIQNGSFIPAAVLDVTGSTYTGSVAPQISGFASVVGTIAKG